AILIASRRAASESMAGGSGALVLDADEVAAADTPAAVGLLFHGVVGEIADPVGADHEHFLGGAELAGLELAELDALRAIDRLVGLGHHLAEDLWALELLPDGGRRVGEGGGPIIDLEGGHLALDHALDSLSIGGRNAIIRGGCANRAQED